MRSCEKEQMRAQGLVSAVGDERKAKEGRKEGDRVPPLLTMRMTQLNTWRGHL